MDSNLNDTENIAKVRRLARVRRYKQRKNPHFRPTNSWAFKRVDERWRRPRGIDNKMRESHRGWPSLVKIGYRTPRLIRHLHVDGKNNVKEEYIVHNISDLELVLPQKHVVRIAHRVGRRKRDDIYSQAISWGLSVINPPSVIEEVGTPETEEDLSLDRDLEDLDLDLDELDESSPITDSDSETESDLESETNDFSDAELPSDDIESEEGEELLADEFKDEITPKSTKKSRKKKSKK
ncbi:MAG: eL32 family ribosomal protein [Candidatus Thorarchaeota archaeon]